jgi:hypothetical protein
MALLAPLLAIVHSYEEPSSEDLWATATMLTPAMKRLREDDVDFAAPLQRLKMYSAQVNTRRYG